jgi:prepilin peptidase CpaA
MQGGYFSYALLGGLAIALLIAAFTDLRRREIDNWLTASIALAAPLFWWASGFTLLDIGIQLAIAAVTFGVLCGLFALGGMGGGDVKLLAALALWIKPIPFATLLVVMSLAGGLVTLVFGGWHVFRRSEGKVAVPYGIAISAAGLWVLATHYFPELSVTR